MFQYFRRHMRLQQLMTGATGLVIGILLSILANMLSEQWLKLVPGLVIIALVLGAVTLSLYVRNPPGIEVAIRAPIVIRTPQEAQQYARRGFVGFVPLYTPKRGSPADQLPIPERKQAVENLDFDSLQLEESNFQPTIVALLSHTSRLEHCWLLSTRGNNSPGSLPYARLLAEYLRQRKGLKCSFHYGEEYSITLDDDAIVLSKTYDQVRRVFAEAFQIGIAPNEMVADIVTGFRSMTLGMILSCLDKDQDIEFVGTHYNELGNPGSDLFPIVFSFEPLMKQE
jgi:hypothetical protein